MEVKDKNIEIQDLKSKLNKIRSDIRNQEVLNDKYNVFNLCKNINSSHFEMKQINWIQIIILLPIVIMGFSISIAQQSNTKPML